MPGLSRVPAVLCMLVLGAAVPLRADDSPLEGGWKFVSVEAEAGMVPVPDPAPTLRFEKERLLYGGEEFAKMSIGTEGELKSIDFSFAKPERTYEGVYVLEKDTLTICLNGQTDGVKERPTSLELEGHPAWRLLKLERIKPEDANRANGFVGMILKFDEDLKAPVIAGTVKDSPAEKAGLQKDDQLLHIGGAPVGDLLQTVGMVRKVEPRKEVVIKVLRQGKEHEVKLTASVFPLQFLLGLE